MSATSNHLMTEPLLRNAPFRRPNETTMTR